MEKYIRNPEIVLREDTSEGGMLFNPDNNQVLVVNATGLVIWQLCDGNYTKSAIIDKLKSEFDAATDEIVEKDVSLFIANMVKANLVGVVQ